MLRTSIRAFQRGSNIGKSVVVKNGYQYNHVNMTVRSISVSSWWNNTKNAIQDSILGLNHIPSIENGSVPTDGTSVPQFPVSTEEAVINGSSIMNQVLVDPNAIIAATEHSNFVIRNVMGMLENIHVMADVPYWGAIALTTVGLRVVLLPVVIKSIQSSARLAVMRPAMQKMQDEFTANGGMNDPKSQMRYQMEMKAMFEKYQVNPFRALLWPLCQLPLFISFFMALRDMGLYYPGYATGGAFWFTDLSVADPTYILPLMNAASFLIMIELGADGMQMQKNTQTLKWGMRALAGIMVPLTASMPQGLFVYWCSNNFLSIVQTMILKQEGLRAKLGIPKPPVDAPDLKVAGNPFKALKEAIINEKPQDAAAKAEILDGVNRNKSVSKPPPMTFSTPPKKK